jgi:hypothetical protein
MFGSPFGVRGWWFVLPLLTNVERVSKNPERNLNTNGELENAEA